MHFGVGFREGFTYTNGNFLGNFPLEVFVARLNKNHGNKWTVIDLLWYGRIESKSDDFCTDCRIRLVLKWEFVKSEVTCFKVTLAKRKLSKLL
jgi:hypothetical protein